jgi:hypothetical protein
MALLPTPLTLPPGLLTDARRRTVRHELQEADRYLSLTLTDRKAAETCERLEFAQAAIRDALRWIDENGDAVTVLVALDGIQVQDISSPAATHITLARLMLNWP